MPTNSKQRMAIAELVEADPQMADLRDRLLDRLPAKGIGPVGASELLYCIGEFLSRPRQIRLMPLAGGGDCANGARLTERAPGADLLTTRSEARAKVDPCTSTTLRIKNEKRAANRRRRLGAL